MCCQVHFGISSLALDYDGFFCGYLKNIIEILTCVHDVIHVNYLCLFWWTFFIFWYNFCLSTLSYVCSVALIICYCTVLNASLWCHSCPKTVRHVTPRIRIRGVSKVIDCGNHLQKLALPPTFSVPCKDFLRVSWKTIPLSLTQWC